MEYLARVEGEAVGLSRDAGGTVTPDLDGAGLMDAGVHAVRDINSY